MSKPWTSSSDSTNIPTGPSDDGSPTSSTKRSALAFRQERSRRFERGDAFERGETILREGEKASPIADETRELSGDSDAVEADEGDEVGANRSHVPDAWVRGVFAPEEAEEIQEALGLDTATPSRDERLEMLVERVSGWLEGAAYEACDDLLARLCTEFADEAREAEHAEALLSTLAEAATEEHGADPDALDERETFLETFDDVIVEREELPGTARALLAAYALDEELFSDPRREEWIENLERRGEETREALIEQGAPYLDLEEAAERLGTSTDEVVEMIERDELIGFRRAGEWHIPEFQFDENDRLLPGLERVLDEIEPANEYSMLTFFLGTYHRLGSRSVVEGLAEGKLDTVLSIARTRGEHVAR